MEFQLKMPISPKISRIGQNEFQIRFLRHFLHSIRKTCILGFTCPLSDEDQWSEDEAEIPTGVTDTLLTSPDFLENDERQHVLNVAPAEGSRPLSVFGNKYCEELAYPGIFLGQKRQGNKDRIVKVHYSDICKSELRRSDRRAAMNVENIFYKTKKLQMKIL